MSADWDAPCSKEPRRSSWGRQDEKKAHTALTLNFFLLQRKSCAPSAHVTCFSYPPPFFLSFFFTDTIKAGSGSVCEHQDFEEEPGGASPSFDTGAGGPVFHLPQGLSRGRDLDEFCLPSRPPWAMQEQYKRSLCANESGAPV